MSPAVGVLRLDGVTAEYATGRRLNLTLWLGPESVTEWEGTPPTAFEIPLSTLGALEVIASPSGHDGKVALTSALHGKYVRWLIPLGTEITVSAIDAWVRAAKSSTS